MKNIKIKIILSAIILLSVMSFVSTVNAASSSLYVSPASLSKTAGDAFNVSVGFNAAGNKVCAVEGTLSFKNLSCQSITVASGVMTQATPTCSNPYFMIGIPNCTTGDKVLFTTTVKAGSAGSASISFTGVDIIGEGTSVGSISTGGNYTIIPIPIPIPKPIPTPQPQPNNGFVGYVNGEIQIFATMELAQQAGATGIQPNYQYSPSRTKTTPKTNTQVTQSNQQTEIPVQQTPSENNLVANTGATDVIPAGSNWFYYFGIALVILIALYGVYYFIKRKKI